MVREHAGTAAISAERQAVVVKIGILPAVRALWHYLPRRWDEPLCLEVLNLRHRTLMSFQMIHIGILGLVLAFSRHVD